MASAQPVVLVTGCSTGGIGYALVQEFVKQRCTVYATARNLENMSGLPGTVRTIALDVTSQQSVDAAVKQVLDENQRIDILVNNAGVLLTAPLVEMDLSAARQVLETNVLGLLAMTQAVAKAMMKQRSGKILNIGSIAGYVSCPYSSIYSASKAAVESITDAARLELKPFGIQVCYVAPGYIKTELAAKNLVTTPRITSPVYKGECEEMLNTVNNGVTSRSATPASELASKVVTLSLRDTMPRDFSYGSNAAIVNTVRWLPPWVLDKMLYSMYKLYSLEK